MKAQGSAGGKKAKWLQQQRERAGKVPKQEAVPDDEELHEGLYYVWDAFSFLSAHRLNNESGPQAIQVEAMWAYVKAHRLDELGVVEDLFQLLNVLDIEWRTIEGDRLAKLRKKELEDAKRKSKQRRRR